MSWQQLPTNFTDAVWSGLKKYMMIENNDDTVSFQDVTQYSQKENSFFGALMANRMNAAMNAIMAALENGTDLYETFQVWFAEQQALFRSEANDKQDALEAYLEGIEDQGDALISQIETGYANDITIFKNTQEAAFAAWFRAMQDALSDDVAGHLQNQCTELDERLSMLEYMTMQNDFSAPIATDETDENTIEFIVDDYDNAILAEWKHKEV